MPAIDISNIVAPLPAAAPPIRITLPGGLAVGGVPLAVGPDALTQAFAVTAAAGPALAPLGPIFTIIEAILSIKDFASSVPELVVNPGAVIEAVANLVRKVGRLASIVPQVSVPLMIVGVIDAVISLLGGLVVVLERIAVQEAQIAAAAARVEEVPSLEAIVTAATAQAAVGKANVLASLEAAGPLLSVINTFAGIVGAPALTVAPATSGTTQELVDSLGAVVDALQVTRSAIPV